MNIIDRIKNSIPGVDKLYFIALATVSVTYRVVKDALPWITLYYIIQL